MSESCEHVFRHISTKKINRSGGGYQSEWIVADRYHCEKCLKEKMVEKKEWDRDVPDFYRNAVEK